MAIKRPLIAVFAILACLMFAWATGAGRSYPANADGVIDPTCTSSSPCIEYDNTSSGPGIRGTSAAGNGIGGTTKFKSTSSTNSRSGIFGNDASSSGSFNAGVSGLSVRGIGVYGSGGSVGVSGTATGATGVGVLATTTNANDQLFEGNNQSGSAFRVDSGGDVFMTGTLQAQSTLFAPAISNNGAPIFVFGVLTADNGLTSRQPLSSNTNYVATDAAGVTWLYQGYSTTAGKYTVEMGDSGSVYARIFITTTAARVSQKTSTGARVDTYTPQVAEPSLEDFGEAQLNGGVATVHFDPRFAAAIDGTTRYFVTLTPEGDCRGLYVAQRDPAGFVVRELQGGRSSIAFTYRIVAKPLGNNSARLALSALPYGFDHNVPAPMIIHRTTRMPPPLAPSR
jgi:hypothetical protein